MGLKYLREHGMLPERVVPSPDERDRILAEWLRQNPRKGLPAPWVSEKWKDDKWAVAQICGRDDRLSVAQVHAIRALATTHSAEDIAARIGAATASRWSVSWVARLTRALFRGSLGAVARQLIFIVIENSARLWPAGRQRRLYVFD